MATRKNLELARLSLRITVRPTRNSFLAADHRFGFGQRHILFKRILGRYGLCGPVGTTSLLSIPRANS